jgi:beta-lactamase regulating signal transducer with metallopeptidase domain
MFGKPLQITLADDDRGVGAAIAGALKAIVVLPHVVDASLAH